MSESNEPETPEPPAAAPSPDPAIPSENPLAPSGTEWARRFLACNPFYPVSAALLLYGFHRVSADSNFLRTELSQLLFNFTSLQFYEILLVATAIFLARRAIWYDSTLLAGLENLFVFVPFILITQGALINQHYVWTMCGIGGLMVAVRCGALRGFIGQLNFPRRLLGPGLALLALNVALPIIYRSLHESNRSGSNPDFGAQFEMSKYTWLLILPAAFALGNFLPDAREVGALLPPQRRWLPSALLALWLTATGVHVYCIDYVYTLHIPTAWFAPALWVLAWTACRRLPQLLALPENISKGALSVVAVLVPLLADSPEGRGIFLGLMTLNVGIFGVLCFTQRDHRLARHLLFVSVFLLVAGLPDEWMRHFSPGSGRGHFLGLGILGYFLLWTVLLRNPKLALLSACALLGATLALFQNRPEAIHWAVQTALTFVLLHSLLWNETDESRAVRIVAAAGWIVHSFIWMHLSDALWAACIPGGLVLGICLIVRLVQGSWMQPFIAVAAALVILSGPANAVFDAARVLPAAPLIVLGSFLCFGLGTIAALTKHRWHHGGQN